MGTTALDDSSDAPLTDLSKMEGQSRGSQNGRICRARAWKTFRGRYRIYKVYYEDHPGVKIRDLAQVLLPGHSSAASIETRPGLYVYENGRRTKCALLN